MPCMAQSIIHGTSAKEGTPKPRKATHNMHRRTPWERGPHLMYKNSSIPYFECSRPMPECLMPPKGATSDVMPTSFTPTMPNSNASATFQLRFKACKVGTAVGDSSPVHPECVRTEDST